MPPWSILVSRCRRCLYSWYSSWVSVKSAVRCNEKYNKVSERERNMILVYRVLFGKERDNDVDITQSSLGTVADRIDKVGQLYRSSGVKKKWLPPFVFPLVCSLGREKWKKIDGIERKVFLSNGSNDGRTRSCVKWISAARWGSYPASRFFDPLSTSSLLFRSQLWYQVPDYSYQGKYRSIVIFEWIWIWMK